MAVLRLARYQPSVKPSPRHATNSVLQKQTRHEGGVLKKENHMEKDGTTVGPINRKQKKATDSASVEFNRMPRWLKREFQALASILAFPNELDATYGDIQPDLFFGSGTSAIARFILGRYDNDGDLPRAEDIENHVRAIYKVEDADRYLRLLRIAPKFCLHHVAHDLIWFAHERRFFRRLVEAFEDLGEQKFSWREFVEYLLRAAELPALERDPVFSRLLALVCRSLLARFPDERPPEPWRQAMEKNALGAKILLKIAMEQIAIWENDEISFFPDESLDLFGDHAAARAALNHLERLGLIQLRMFEEVNGTRKFEEMRLTSRAWELLLSADEED